MTWIVKDCGKPQIERTEDSWRFLTGSLPLGTITGYVLSITKFAVAGRIWGTADRLWRGSIDWRRSLAREFQPEAYLEEASSSTLAISIYSRFLQLLSDFYPAFPTH